MNRSAQPLRVGLLAAAVALAVSAGLPADEPAARPVYRSPVAVAWAADGRAVYACDATAGCVVRLAPGEEPEAIARGPEPSDLVLAADGSRLYVAYGGDDRIDAVALPGGQVVATGRVGRRPRAVALGPTSNRLYVCNQGSGDVSVLAGDDLSKIARVELIREPRFAALSPDGSVLVVANALPKGSPTKAFLAAAVSLVDTRTLEVTEVPLCNGATNLRGVAVGPRGRWAWCVHTVSRFHLPTTQLERGWMNTAGLSLIDLQRKRLETTVLLDSLDRGAADPWGVAVAPDGQMLYVSLSGTHELMRVEIGRLLQLLSGKIPPEVARDPGQANTNVWARIAQSPEAKDELVNDLMAMDYAGLLRRVPCGGRGPRGMALSPDGARLAVANYFSGKVALLPVEALEVPAPADIEPLQKAVELPCTTVSLGPQPPADAIRRGEAIFHDAEMAFQHWQSCATCHPEGRSDGLRWDLLNDGIGNPKKTRSLVGSFGIRPVMSLGVRENAQAGVRAGFQHILFTRAPQESCEAVDAYIESLRPRPGPGVAADGSLGALARRGKAIFMGKAQCGRCHHGPLWTDMQRHRVVPPAPYDRDDEGFVTPRLVELHRTAPYLHDGRAATLRELLTTFNPDDCHGHTSGLSDEEVDALIALLETL